MTSKDSAKYWAKDRGNMSRLSTSNTGPGRCTSMWNMYTAVEARKDRENMILEVPFGTEMSMVRGE